MAYRVDRIGKSSNNAPILSTILLPNNRGEVYPSLLSVFCQSFFQFTNQAVTSFLGTNSFIDRSRIN